MAIEHNWHDILWREWHFTHDEVYAEQLHFALAKDDIGQPDLTDAVQGRPLLPEVEAALRQGLRRSSSVRQFWGGRIQRLDEEKAEYISVGRSVKDLSHVHWFRRFLGRHLLVEIGGHAVDALEKVAYGPNAFAKKDARWVLECIAADTTARLSGEPENWICPDCWVSCGPLWIDRPWRPDWQFYGCRHCQRSHQLFHSTQEMVAVLDNKGQGITFKDGLVRANWFTRRTLFDFDRVEIVRATDEEVERFAVQVGNDTDSVRRPRYPHIRCTIAPECSLSTNTLRILRNSFGHVEQTAS
ncbi:MAG: hypothetical protein KDJ65_12795 [Anaerolineae bacterium]|nr:hypothetical protein [Anaerolineae bacterium]